MRSAYADRIDVEISVHAQKTPCVIPWTRGIGKVQYGLGDFDHQAVYTNGTEAGWDKATTSIMDH